MNSAIETWTSSYQRPFATEGFSVSATYKATLQQDNSKDLAITDGMNNYLPVKFDSRTTILQSMTWNAGYKQAIQFTSSGNSTGQFNVNVELFSTFQSNDGQSLCNSNNGEWNHGICYYFYVLSEVCVKVSQQAGVTVLDTTYGGPGCWYANGYPSDISLWIPAMYRKVPYNNGGIFQQTFSFLNMPVTVRNQHDPYIFAENLTRGSLSFGLTAGQKFIIGIALMAIGGFFMLPCCIFIVVLAVCCNRKHHHHHYQSL